MISRKIKGSMNKSEKSYQELFEGLCKVLAENSEPLSAEQTKALSGFLDVLVESINKNWGTTIQSFYKEHKAALELKGKIALEKNNKMWEEKVKDLLEQVKTNVDLKKDLKDKEKSNDKPNLETVVEMLKELQDKVDAKSTDECEKVKKEFATFREESIAKTAQAVKAVQTEAEVIKQQCASMKADSEKKDEDLKVAGEKIKQLESALNIEKLKTYLETKISGLPTYEATLIRKRFAGAKSKEEIDNDFDNILTSVRERRNVASKEPMPGSRTLTVQPNRLSETARAQGRVSLLTERAPNSTEDAVFAASDDDGDFTLIDSDVIPQSDMARWISAV